MTNQRLRSVVLLSILAAVVTLGLKFLAFALTGSAGLLSDAVEAIVNLLAALTAYFSLAFAARPVDENHTYGHEKIEFFSSGVEGILILVASLGIAWFAAHRLLTGARPEALGRGMALALAAAAINAVVARVLLHFGRKHQSIVLEADGRHLMTDVWASVAVVVGLSLFGLTEWAGRPLYWIDPLVALLAAANVLWTAVDLLRRSFNGLMDHALPPGEQQAVRAAIERQLGPDMTYHALRTRQAGARRFVDFHLLVPGHYTVQRAHALTGRIEDAVRAALPGLEVTVHIEPIEEPASWQDSALLPVEEAARREQRQ